MKRRSGTRRTASLREVRLPSADVFPTVLRYSICTPCPLTLSLPLSAFGGGGAVGSVHAVGDGSIGTEQVFVGRWSECVGICYFQTVGSASALSERTSRSEAVNLVSATHFHERATAYAHPAPVRLPLSSSQSTYEEVTSSYHNMPGSYQDNGYEDSQISALLPIYCH